VKHVHHLALVDCISDLLSYTAPLQHNLQVMLVKQSYCYSLLYTWIRSFLIWHLIPLFPIARSGSLAHCLLPDLWTARSRVLDLHHLRHKSGAALEQAQGWNGRGGCPEDAWEAGRLSLIGPKFCSGKIAFVEWNLENVSKISASFSIRVTKNVTEIPASLYPKVIDTKIDDKNSSILNSCCKISDA